MLIKRMLITIVLLLSCIQASAASCLSKLVSRPAVLVAEGALFGTKSNAFCEENPRVVTSAKWLERARKCSSEKGVRCDLRGANLEGANLTGANLEGANLTEADSYGANLEGADLKRADLRFANLEGTNLEGANLEGANLTEADLRLANLEGTNLKRSDLRLADLSKTKHGKCSSSLTRFFSGTQNAADLTEGELAQRLAAGLAVCGTAPDYRAFE